MKRAVILKYLVAQALTLPPPESLEQCKNRWSDQEWTDFVQKGRLQARKQVQAFRSNGLWNEMEDNERSFFEAGPADFSRQAIIDASWKAESAECLFWALGFASEIPPYDTEAKVEGSIYLPKEPIPDLVKKARLRDSKEIEKQRDIAELWHWRSRTRQLQEEGRMPALVGGKLTVREMLQVTSSKAAENGDIPTPIDGDFPAFGKSYANLTREQYSRATSIAQERHRAFNWLCGYAPKNKWSETPTDT